MLSFNRIHELLHTKDEIDDLLFKDKKRETTFAALIHDLRNPLTSIVHCIDTLKEKSA